MKRTLVVALLPLVAVPLGVAGGAGTAAAEADGAGCVEPVAQRNYSHRQLDYRLSIDLTDCDWWDGSPIQLEASIDRFDATESQGTATGVVCASALAVTPENTEPPGIATSAEPPSDRAGTCDVEVTMDHPPAEVARYRGEISFPWQGGRRTASFVALCGPAGSCVDLPADPTDALAPAADLYDAIAGGDDSAG